MTRKVLWSCIPYIVQAALNMQLYTYNEIKNTEI